MGKNPLIPDGKISRAVRHGLIRRAQLLAEGRLTTAEIDVLVGQDLKAAWGESNQSDRTEPWYAICKKCTDSGWIIVQPTYVEQKRLQQLYGDTTSHQDYMRRCDPCPWLEMEREKRRKTVGEFEGLAAAGQMRRSPRKF